MPATHRGKGILFAQLNALCAGSMMAIGKEVTGEHLPNPLEPQVFVALMYLIVGPVNTVWWLLTKYGLIRNLHRSEKEHEQRAMTFRGIGWMLLHTTASAIGIIGLWEGLSRASSAAGSLLSRTEVVIAIILGMMFLGERFLRRHWWGFALTVVGLVLVKWGDIQLDWVAFAWLMLGAVGFGASEFTGKVAVKYWPAPRLVMVRGWLMAAILCANWWLQYPGWPTHLTAEMWLWLVVSALLGPVLARNNYMLALSFLPVSQVVLLNQAQPLYAAVVGFVLRGEIPLPLFYLGAVAIVAGNIVLIKARERSRQQVAA
jgi:drug/metabolite transporter (DMT)-like permease